MSGMKDMNRRGTAKRQSYVVKTQHGDVRRNRRHLKSTPMAPTYNALPADVDFPIDLAEESGRTDGCRSTTRENLSHLSRDITLQESEIYVPNSVIIMLLRRVIAMKVSIHDGSCVIQINLWSKLSLFVDIIIVRGQYW